MFFFSSRQKLSQKEILLKIRSIYSLQQREQFALYEAFEKLQGGGGVSYREAKKLLKQLRYDEVISERDRKLILKELFQ